MRVIYRYQLILNLEAVMMLEFITQLGTFVAILAIGICTMYVLAYLITILIDFITTRRK